MKKLTGSSGNQPLAFVMMVMILYFVTLSPKVNSSTHSCHLCQGYDFICSFHVCLGVARTEGVMPMALNFVMIVLVWPKVIQFHLWRVNCQCLGC
jgi:hypothetical protein